MPHIDIKCFPGRTEEQKTECAEKVAEVVSEALGCKLTSVSVTIKDVAEEDWKTEVWDKEIVQNDKFLYKKPGYSCDR